MQRTNPPGFDTDRARTGQAKISPSPAMPPHFLALRDAHLGTSCQLPYLALLPLFSHMCRPSFLSLFIVACQTLLVVGHRDFRQPSLGAAWDQGVAILSLGGDCSHAPSHPGIFLYSLAFLSWVYYPRPPHSASRILSCFLYLIVLWAGMGRWTLGIDTTGFRAWELGYCGNRIWAFDILDGAVRCLFWLQGGGRHQPSGHRSSSHSLD